ncbi:hypothetical protein GGP65_002492, partial [Salinibacter ruber]|nr:hypothetical protein [Salinibacter ruber]
MWTEIAIALVVITAAGTAFLSRTTKERKRHLLVQFIALDLFQLWLGRYGA